MKKTNYLLILASFLFMLGCQTDSIEKNYAVESFESVNAVTDGGSGINEGIVYDLPEVGNSGISGTVTLTDLGADGSHIFVDLQGTDKNTTYPTHIHLGPADGGGPVIVDLNPVDGERGTSTTIVTHREDTGEVFDYDDLTGIDEYYIASHNSTHTGAVVARGNIGVADPTPFPCEECAGHVNQLTLKFNGDAPATITIAQEDGRIVFDEEVDSGEMFTFFGSVQGDDSFGDQIEIMINGMPAETIRTACEVDPIGPGFEIGLFEVVMGFSSLVHGPLCPFMPPVPCAECDGKVSQLTLQYNGNENAMVRIEQKKGEVVYENFLSPNQVFTFDGMDKKETLSPEIIVYVNDIKLHKVHTSCSEPIGPGLVFGDFEVLNGFSRNGNGPLCPVNENPMGCMECDGGVTSLTVKLTKGESGQVVVLGKDDEDVYFDGSVSPNEEFDLSPLNDDDKLDKTLRLFFNGREKGDFHTSCSQPIGPGVSISGFEIVSGTSRDGGELCPAENDNGDDGDDDDGDDDDGDDDGDDDDGDDDDGDDDDGDDDDGDDDGDDDDGDDDDDNNQDGTCNDCSGKVNQLTIRYTSNSSEMVRIVQQKGEVVFEGTLFPQEEIIINGRDKKGTLSPRIEFFENGQYSTMLHTSCSEPIGPGTRAGNFLVVEGTSRNGGELCEQDDVPPVLD